MCSFRFHCDQQFWLLGDNSTPLGPNLAMKLARNKFEKELNAVDGLVLPVSNPSSLVTIAPQLSVRLSINAAPPSPPPLLWVSIANVSLCALRCITIAVLCITQLIKLSALVLR